MHGEAEKVFQIKLFITANNRSGFTQRLTVIKLAESLRDLEGYAGYQLDTLQSLGPLREEAFLTTLTYPELSKKAQVTPPSWGGRAL